MKNIFRVVGVALRANRLRRRAMHLLNQGLDIRRKDAMVRSLIDKSIVGVVICDDACVIESINGAAAAMFGYTESALAGMAFERLVPSAGPSDGTARPPLKDIACAGHRELWGRRRDGGTFPIEVTANELTIDGHTSYVAFINDITLRRRHEQELEFRADHDSLTQLPNREKFARVVDAALAEARGAGAAVAVYLLDLDRFKEVNDTLGHAVGDRLLQDVAERLSATMTKGATLARFGGDEFAICLPRVVHTAAVETFAGAIINALKQPFEVDEVMLEVGGSIGFALYPDDGDNTEILLQRADIAMYSAKRFQSGFSKYWAEDDAHSVRNLTLTGDLRRAIEENELALVFQPKVNIATGEVMGAEVLCRWDRPDHGRVSPEEFIGHAEQSGLIYPLTQWVLRKAVAKAAVWREIGWDINIAVNLSARLLHHEHILDLVSGVLQTWEYPAEKLTLEITENALLVNPAHAMIVISEFAALGIKVSIDDFGTGYSSLSYLTTLAASELKIDKSFVLGMAKEDSFKTIVKSVVTMAHELGMRVVAEGIEDDQAVAVLRRFGCDIGQGYYFGKPMSEAGFENWLRTDKWAARRLVGDLAATRA